MISCTPFQKLFAQFKTCFLVILCTISFAPIAQSQEPPNFPERPVLVGLYYSPPFVMEENGEHTGMAIDLWEAIAAEHNLDFEYQSFETFRTLVDAAANKQIDVAVTNLTITENRAKRIDFTQPWFDAGLRIMINDNQRAGLWDVILGLRDAGYLWAYAWLASIIVIATLGFTLFDRRFDKDFPSRWRDGVAESFYAVMSIATSGKAPARKNLFGWIGRLWQGVWLICGIAVLAYVTSSVTSVMTTLSLTNQINGLSDLPGKTIGVAEGSTAEEFAQSSLFSFRSFDGIDELSAALINGRVDAVIGDKPVLEYYAHTHPEIPISVVGSIFHPDKYGFGLQHRSPWTKALTIEVVGAQESGLVKELRTKYFGNTP